MKRNFLYVPYNKGFISRNLQITLLYRWYPSYFTVNSIIPTAYPKPFYIVKFNIYISRTNRLLILKKRGKTKIVEKKLPVTVNLLQSSYTI